MPPKNCDTMKPDCYPGCSCQTNVSCVKAVIFDDSSTSTKHGNKLMSSCHQAVTKKSTYCQKFLNYHQEKLFFRTDEEEHVEMTRVVIFKMSINVNTHSLDLTAKVPLDKIV